MTRRLIALERVARDHGEGSADKLRLLERLAEDELPSAAQVHRLHEVLCYLRALPDDAAVLAQVEAMLAAFPSRRDLVRFAPVLADSGIAGTDTRFPFFAPTARWLAERWGDRLHVDWDAAPDEAPLLDRVYLLALEAETPGLDHADLTARGWVDRMRGASETDAAFLVRRMAGLPWDPNLRDVLYQELQLPLRLDGGPDGPSRTRARLPGGRVHWQTRPLDTSRPDLVREARRPPRAVRQATQTEGRDVVDLAREAMVARARDLDAFAGADPRDVRIVDCGDGLEFAVMGVEPRWRMLLDAVHGWLILRNRVPIGYVLTSALFRSSEIALNVFDTWRGLDAARIYGRIVGTTRALFRSETFTVYPYQLGHGNPEGLASGAWWFYQKLGFRPRDEKTLALMEQELKRIRSRSNHRSSRATLERLAASNVFLETGRRRKTVIGTFPYAGLGLAITDLLATRFGSRREEAEPVLADEAAARYGAGRWRRFPPDERRAWRHWAPVLVLLPGVERWSRRERADAVRVVRAKGGPREDAFVHAFDAHRRLGPALVRLATRRRVPPRT